MRVLVFEPNLMWSARLKRSLVALGHEPVLRTSYAREPADAAIVNLGESALDPTALIDALHQSGVPVIAHAGHKEKELAALGRQAGADVLATNSQLTFKLEELLSLVKLPEN